MPNQRAPKKKQTSVVFHESLIAELDAIADAEDRSRNYIINKFLLDQVEKRKKEKSVIFTKEPEKVIMPTKNDKNKVQQQVDKIEQKNKEKEPNTKYKKAS